MMSKIRAFNAVVYVLVVVPFAILTFMALLQAFVFMILTYVYLAGAVLVDGEEH